MKSKNLIITFILIIVFVGIGFFAGMKYQQNRNSALGNLGGRGTYGARFGGANRFGPSGMQAVRGQIVSADSSSITIKLADGSSKIVILPDNVNILQTAKASISDLKNGINVMVFGTTNTDGSVTASSVQLNPLERGKLGTANQ